MLVTDHGAFVLFNVYGEWVGAWVGRWVGGWPRAVVVVVVAAEGSQFM